MTTVTYAVSDLVRAARLGGGVGRASVGPAVGRVVVLGNILGGGRAQEFAIVANTGGRGEDVGILDLAARVVDGVW